MRNSFAENFADSDVTNTLAEYLRMDDLLDSKTATKAICTARERGISLAAYLVRSEILSSQKILHCCHKYLGLEIVDLHQFDSSTASNDLIKPEMIHRYHVLPMSHNQHTLRLAMTDPTDHAAITAISLHTGLRVHPVLAPVDETDRIINRFFTSAMLHSHLASTLSKIAPPDEEVSAHDEMEDSDEPVIEFVNQIINDAVSKNVSDIHLEPFTNHCRIRFRCDGLLHEAATIPSHLSARVLTRLKIMAHMNIAERRIPQDGRIQLRQHDCVDIRISTCPTVYGEKMALRLLNSSNKKMDIDALGMSTAQTKLFIEKLSGTQGLILVTGPTGSGKTLTLYSALQYLNCIEKNISTVEDPVEIELPGINQVNINTKINLGFAAVLRTLLRQDPDIIMIGEIRDTDTAAIALQAAQTGHLVLSTLHTNSAAAAINRLQSMGVAAWNLINSLSLVIAQRLVRKLCQRCRQPEILSSGYGYRAIGCEHCQHGYQGRTGIFEMIAIDETLAQLALSNASVAQIAAHSKQLGTALLWDAGMEKIREGVTSHAEILRVIENKDCT